MLFSSGDQLILVSNGRSVTCIQIDGLAGGGVVDAYFYLVAGHSCHRVTDVIHFSYTCGDVYKRVLRHHAFVHAVESEQVAFRAPEGTFVDAEFIAVDGLPQTMPSGSSVIACSFTYRLLLTV